MVAQEESNKELVEMCKKHMTFKTPAKANVLGNLLRDINDLTNLNHVISDLVTMTLNGKGECMDQTVEFSEQGFEEIFNSLRERLDYLSNHSSIVFNVDHLGLAFCEQSTCDKFLADIHNLVLQ